MPRPETSSRAILPATENYHVQEIIFALIVVASQGGEPGYEKVFSTEAGCQRAVTTQTTEKGAAAAWCARIEIDLTQPEN